VTLCARVSSSQQAERHTIDSQCAELKARALQDKVPLLGAREFPAGRDKEEDKTKLGEEIHGPCA